MGRFLRSLALVAMGLLGPGMLLAAPANAAQVCRTGPTGAPYCYDNSSGEIPPPPVGYIAPQPPPALAGDGPWDGKSPLVYPAPRPAAPAPAPYVAPLAPVAPVQGYQRSTGSAPVHVAPAPVYGQPAAPGYEAPPAPATDTVEATAAPNSVQDAPTPAPTPTVAPTPSAAPVAAPSGTAQPVPAQNSQSSGDIAAVGQVSDAAPAVVTAALVAAGALAVVVFLRFGPGVSGIRGIARGIIRR
jgi:hypothetical protein